MIREVFFFTCTTEASFDNGIVDLVLLYLNLFCVVEVMEIDLLVTVEFK